MKVDALENAAAEVLAAKDKLIALLDEDVRNGFQKTRGLLSYGIAMGRATPDARSDPDRKAEHKAVNLCLQHGNLGDKDDEAGAEDAILRQFEALTDPDERSRFYQRHRAELMKAHDVRQFPDP
jgi:hypothetical protein